MTLGRKQKIAILYRTREILARPGGWTKGKFSRLKPEGNPYSFSVDDRSFCLVGAARQALREIAPTQHMNETELCEKLSIATLAKAKLADKPGVLKGVEEYGSNPVFAFNDASSTRKRDVIALLDEKIAELEA